MTWLTNISDPSRDPHGQTVLTLPGQSHGDAVAAFRYWLRDKVIGDPMATDAYSVAELKIMGIVGVYAEGR